MRWDLQFGLRRRNAGAVWLAIKFNWHNDKGHKDEETCDWKRCHFQSIISYVKFVFLIEAIERIKLFKKKSVLEKIKEIYLLSVDDENNEDTNTIKSDLDFIANM